MKEDRVKEAYDEIDLYEYLRVIWKWRWLIAIGVIVATLAAIPASYLVRSYESHGVLRLSESIAGGAGEELQQKDFLEKPLGEVIVELSRPKTGIIVTLPEYKIYDTVLMDSRAFLEYLKRHELLSGEEMATVRKLNQNCIEPLYAYTDQEVKNVKPQEQFIYAVQLSWKGPSPTLAQKMVHAIGLFVKNTIEKKVMEGYVTQGYQEAYTNVQEFKRGLINLGFSLKQNEQKLADLKKIAQGSPEAGQLTGREVVSVDQGGQRYLPPSTQIVAAQVEIADTRLEIAETERMLKINRVKLELFTRLKNALATEDAKSLFEHLTEIKDEFFQGKDLRSDEILIARNEVSADFARFEHRFNDVMEFISGPTLPQRAKPSKRIVVAVTFFLGLFFFTFLAFFLEFIQRGRQRESIAEKQKTKSK